MGKSLSGGALYAGIIKLPALAQLLLVMLAATVLYHQVCEAHARWMAGLRWKCRADDNPLTNVAYRWCRPDSVVLLRCSWRWPDAAPCSFA
jgi:hypothetical protein